MVYKQFMCDWEKMSQANHAIFSRLICINLPHNFLQLTFFYTQNFVCKNLQYLSPFNSVHLIFRLLHLYTAVLFNSYPTLGGNLGCAYIQNASISTLLKKTSLKPLVQHSIVYIFYHTTIPLILFPISTTTAQSRLCAPLGVIRNKVRRLLLLILPVIEQIISLVAIALFQCQV